MMVHIEVVMVSWCSVKWSVWGQIKHTVHTVCQRLAHNLSRPGIIIEAHKPSLIVQNSDLQPVVQQFTLYLIDGILPGKSIDKHVFPIVNCILRLGTYVYKDFHCKTPRSGSSD